MMDILVEQVSEAPSFYKLDVDGRLNRIEDGDEAHFASVLGVKVDDLTHLPFGSGSAMWMVKSAQLDKTAPINIAASHALRLNGLDLAIRGPVALRRQAPPRRRR